jgi:hypothetical protein
MYIGVLFLALYVWKTTVYVFVCFFFAIVSREIKALMIQVFFNDCFSRHIILFCFFSFLLLNFCLLYVHSVFIIPFLFSFFYIFLFLSLCLYLLYFNLCLSFLFFPFLTRLQLPVALKRFSCVHSFYAFRVFDAKVHWTSTNEKKWLKVHCRSCYSKFVPAKVLTSNFFASKLKN